MTVAVGGDGGHLVIDGRQVLRVVVEGDGVPAGLLSEILDPVALLGEGVHDV